MHALHVTQRKLKLYSYVDEALHGITQFGPAMDIRRYVLVQLQINGINTNPIASYM